MSSDHLIVNKKILPPYLEKVIEARELLNSHQVSTVTDAVERVGISRNTYYKYKDYVFVPTDQGYRKRAVLSLVLKDEAGSLSAVLSMLSSIHASVITISQSIPLSGKASVTIALDISNVDLDINTILAQLKSLNQVISVVLDAME